MPKELAEGLLNEIKTNVQACNLDEIPQGYGRFGLDKTNPIPVYGIPSSKYYLDRLRQKNKRPISYRRNSNMNSHNITKLLDEYDIFDENGDKLCELYISPYHWKTSDKAPEGFILD